jgi:hypothetical protein
MFFFSMASAVRIISCASAVSPSRKPFDSGGRW